MIRFLTLEILPLNMTDPILISTTSKAPALLAIKKSVLTTATFYSEDPP